MGPGWGEAGATETSGTGLFGDAPIATLARRGLPRAHLGPAGIRQVDRHDHRRQRHRRRPRRPAADRLGRHPTRRAARREDGSARRHGRRFLRRRHPARDRGHRLPRRRDRADHRVALPRNEPEQGRHGQARLVQPPLQRGAAAGRSTRTSPPRTSPARRRGRSRPPTAPGSSARGPGALVAKITAPTLLIQGTVDTLFTLDEAVTNYGILRKHGVPTAMLWYCGGHGTCLTDSGDPKAMQDATDAWLQRWLRNDTTVRHGTPYQRDRPARRAVHRPRLAAPRRSHPVAATGRATSTSPPTAAPDRRRRSRDRRARSTASRARSRPAGRPTRST